MWLGGCKQEVFPGNSPEHRLASSLSPKFHFSLPRWELCGASEEQELRSQVRLSRRDTHTETNTHKKYKKTNTQNTTINKHSRRSRWELGAIFAKKELRSKVRLSYSHLAHNYVETRHNQTCKVLIMIDLSNHVAIAGRLLGTRGVEDCPKLNIW